MGQRWIGSVALDCSGIQSFWRGGGATSTLNLQLDFSWHGLNTRGKISTHEGFFLLLRNGHIRYELRPCRTKQTMSFFLCIASHAVKFLPLTRQLLPMADLVARSACVFVGWALPRWMCASTVASDVVNRGCRML